MARWSSFRGKRIGGEGEEDLDPEGSDDIVGQPRANRGRVIGRRSWWRRTAPQRIKSNPPYFDIDETPLDANDPSLNPPGTDSSLNLERRVGSRGIGAGLKERLTEGLTNLSENPETYEFMKDLGIGVAKAGGVLLGSLISGALTSYVLSYIPVVGRPIGGVVGPLVTGTLGWYLSDRVFNDHSNKRFSIDNVMEFSTKAIALGVGALGAIAGASEAVNFSIDHLVVRSLKPDVLKGYATQIANYIKLPALLAAPVISALNVFGNKDVVQMKNQVMDYMREYRGPIMLAGAAVPIYFGADYLSELLGIKDQSVKKLISHGIPTSAVYLLSNFIENKWLRRGTKAAAAGYAGVLLHATGLPSYLANYMPELSKDFTKNYMTAESIKNGAAGALSYALPFGVLQGISSLASRISRRRHDPFSDLYRTRY